MIDKLISLGKKFNNPCEYQVKYRRNSNGVEMIYILLYAFVNEKWKRYTKAISLENAEKRQDEIISEIIKNIFEN